MNKTQKLEAVASFARAHGWMAVTMFDNSLTPTSVQVTFGDHPFSVRTAEVYSMAGLLSAAGGRNEDGTEL